MRTSTDTATDGNDAWWTCTASEYFLLNGYYKIIGEFRPVSKRGSRVFTQTPLFGLQKHHLAVHFKFPTTCRLSTSLTVWLWRSSGWMQNARKCVDRWLFQVLKSLPVSYPSRGSLPTMKRNWLNSLESYILLVLDAYVHTRHPCNHPSENSGYGPGITYRQFRLGLNY